MKGRIEAWTARGKDGRDGASGGGIEQGREGARGWGENVKGGFPRWAQASVQYIHKPFHKAALGLETLVLQMKNSVTGINYKLCIVMRHNVLFDRWMT